MPTAASLAWAKAGEKAEREQWHKIEVTCKECGEHYTEDGNGSDKCKKGTGSEEKYHPKDWTGYKGNITTAEQGRAAWSRNQTAHVSCGPLL